MHIMRTVMILAALALTLLPTPLRAESGRQLFDSPFDGNGQTCEGCHRADQMRSMSPAKAQQICASNPASPLCLPINGKGANSSDLSDLFTRARVGIPVVIPWNVDVEPVSPDAVVHTDAAGVRTIFFPRRIPTTANLLAKVDDGGALMLDGREGTNFLQQSVDAVRTHNGPSAIDPTPLQQQKLVNFELKSFSSPAMRRFIEDGTQRVLPPGGNDELRFGRSVITTQCAQCHAGPNMDQTGPDNIVTKIFGPIFGFTNGNKFQSNQIGAAQVDTGAPKYRFRVHRVDANGNPVQYVNPLTFQPEFDANGQPVMEVREQVSEDLGSVLNPVGLDGHADPCAKDVTICLINNAPIRTGPALNSVFTTTSLWDIGDRDALGLSYLHSGEPTLEGVMSKFYVPLFQATVFGLQPLTTDNLMPLLLDEQNSAAAIAFMRQCMKRYPDSACFDHSHTHGDGCGADDDDLAFLFSGLLFDCAYLHGRDAAARLARFFLTLMGEQSSWSDLYSTARTVSCAGSTGSQTTAQT